jgi:hypothetical protein
MSKLVLNGSFHKPKPSRKNIEKFIQCLSETKGIIVEIRVYRKRTRACFISICENCKKKVTIPINVGANDKTPLTGENYFLIGRSRVRGVRVIISESIDDAIFARTSNQNLGAAFIGFDAIDADGRNRGMGFHGSSKNLLSETDGCIRMYNDDLLLLGPYMLPGVKVFIET